MPAVLVLILCVVHAAIRREGFPAVNPANLTVGELVASLQMAREVEQARRGTPDQNLPSEPKPDAESAVEPAAAVDENVTPLSSARQTK